MHRSHSLAQSGSLMRAFFLFVLLIGVQFTALTSFVVARGAANTIGNPKLVSNKPQVVKPQHTMGKSNPHARMTGGPDLGISILPSSPTYNVGNTVSYTLTITNGPTADPILVGPVTVTDVLPSGLTNVTATSSTAGAWSFTGANTNSPTLVTATYTGLFPITAGAILATIGIAGIANSQATGLFTTVATVEVSGDLNLSNNTSNVSVNIAPSATPTVSTTAIATLTPVIPTTTATAVSTTTATAVSTTTATAVSTTTATAVSTTTATAVSTTTATAVSTTTATAVSTPVVTSPNITINATVEGATTTFQPGQPVTYDLVVTNSSTAGPTTGPVVVSDVVPLGLTNLVASGTGWTTTLTDTVGPALMTATYAAIVAPGQTIAPLHLTGVLASTANMTLSNTAQAFSAGNSATSPSSNVTVINVLPSLTSTVTPTVVATPCTVTSITLPCIATATAVSCLVPIPGGVATTATATTATAIATATVTTVATSSCSSGPDVSLTETMLSGSSTASSSTPSSDLYTVGDQVTYILLVNALTNGGPVTQPITVQDVLPIGATDIHASGSNWVYSISNKTSPSVLSATYTGSYPVAIGAGLSPLLVSLTLTADAVKSFTTSATVDTLGDINLANNTYTNTLFVQEQKDKDKNNNNHDQNNNNHNQNNNNHNQNNHNQNNNNHNQNNQNNNYQNNNQNSNNYRAPGLPGTGSDPDVRSAARVE